MSGVAWLQLILYFTALTALAWPLGSYMARVYRGERTMPAPVLAPVERLIYRLARVQPEDDMSWQRYAVAVLVFNLLGTLVVYTLQRLQGYLPLNPQDFGAVTADSSFNTAVSFATNTNWQGYGGESTMSYLTQMLGLGVQNFLSAGTGMAVLVAFIRGLMRRQSAAIGNFWVDLTRSTLYILLPLAVVLSLALVSQGVVQNFDKAVNVPLVQPVEVVTPARDGAPEKKVTIATQSLPQGPAASQIAIKQLGTNGGGFFNVNSAHPYENPTPLSNFLEMLAILLVPAGLCFTFGRLVNDTRQGWAIYAAMSAIFLTLTVGAMVAEETPNPRVTALGVETGAGNVEGKEVRFGVPTSVLWATATTSASNGSVNSMHDSYMPLAGLVPMWLMQLGEVVYGGVGSGLYGMLVFAIIAVFIAGLMVGRTPEYLGKKIQAYEMKMAALVILIPPALVLVGAALAVVIEPGTAGMSNPGAHGFSQALYAFSSAGNNNGSAFAGLSANTPFYNSALGVAMWLARYWLIVPVLAIAGSLAAKKHVPASTGTLPTHTPLFVGLLIGTVLLVGALTFVPALALGPVIEHLLLFAK
ncbi:MAG TPA: potassium-transporting ATPase subunit KdpA [Burkholderiaceae bacterium]|nr:potassium-transporting ATPase subunit KdpA [Burkholderiaceae bacterium]HQR70954.1 potassium-transporting ATPase subunit KdpA [Burkholderiaceae bacterium]